jgi:hypothetical protein
MNRAGVDFSMNYHSSMNIRNDPIAEENIFFLSLTSLALALAYYPHLQSTLL